MICDECHWVITRPRENFRPTGRNGVYERMMSGEAEMSEILENSDNFIQLLISVNPYKSRILLISKGAGLFSDII